MFKLLFHIHKTNKNHSYIPPGGGGCGWRIIWGGGPLGILPGGPLGIPPGGPIDPGGPWGNGGNWLLSWSRLKKSLLCEPSAAMGGSGKAGFEQTFQVIYINLYLTDRENHQIFFTFSHDCDTVDILHNEFSTGNRWFATIWNTTRTVHDIGRQVPWSPACLGQWWLVIILL